MSILEKLGFEDEQILNVELSKDKKTIELEEACDMYFSVDLNKVDFGLLIDELIDLHEQMVDS